MPLAERQVSLVSPSTSLNRWSFGLPCLPCFSRSSPCARSTSQLQTSQLASYKLVQTSFGKVCTACRLSICSLEMFTLGLQASDGMTSMIRSC